jgi:hypothetical protein
MQQQESRGGVEAWKCGSREAAKPRVEDLALIEDPLD